MAKQSARNRPLALTSPKQRQGSRFEAQARQFLIRQGLILIAQNWQQPKVGELDLVMLEKGTAWSTLVFVEVRQRQRSTYGDAALSVTKAKQRKIIKTAKCFLQRHPEYSNCECRFDVIAYNTTRPSTDVVKDIYEDSGSSDDNTKNNKTDKMLSMDSDPPEWLAGAFVASAW